MEHPEFKSVLQQVWPTENHEHPMENVWWKLKKLKAKLKDINTYMASYQQHLSLAREKLDIVQGQMQGQLLRQELFEQEKKLLHDIEKWSKVEEQVIRHKARALWVKSGDGNSKYFQVQWKMRRSQNTITSIYTESNIKLTDPRVIENEFISVFSGLMGECVDDLPCVDTMVVRAGECITV
ncbi:hypothetical protein R3W88_001197 [Solanum pinnatisectum]|uniref:Uncharacterized protein n=1 Tax=Solanum pinnatisectum TaxID=50273 RepID=A0AAV9MHJ6_9SOLN|nr:hypothetical protein R3W88_001197 [Solanum pinnatisectum]